MRLSDPKDYYHVRFAKPADPDTGVVEGYEGIVIAEEQGSAIVEVAPWDENGEPLVIVTVRADHLERLAAPVDPAQSTRIWQRWEDMEWWRKTRLPKGEKAT